MCLWCCWKDLDEQDLMEVGSPKEKTIIILAKFCDVTTSVMIPQEKLAKFGYRSARKI
jgi:hypothetical protein